MIWRGAVVGQLLFQRSVLEREKKDKDEDNKKKARVQQRSKRKQMEWVLDSANEERKENVILWVPLPEHAKQ